MFEMLGLYEEALIQYDEIDALLTQMIINSQFGGTTFHLYSSGILFWSHKYGTCT